MDFEWFYRVPIKVSLVILVFNYHFYTIRLCLRSLISTFIVQAT